MSVSLTDRRILIVEDEYFIAQDIARAFRAFGARVLGPTPTAEAAIAMAHQESIDAAVLDIHLRGGSTVYTLADLLLSKGVPFLFATGYERSTIPARFATIRVCEKPVEPAAIASALVEEIPERLEALGERLTYSIRKEGLSWRWYARKDDYVIDQGNAVSSISARVAAFSAAMRRFH